MSVSTYTLSVKRHQLTANKFILSFNATFVGDASGGNVGAAIDVASYIPNNSDVTLIDISEQQQGAANMEFHCYVEPSQWTLHNQPYVLGYDPNFELANSAPDTWMSSKDSVCCTLPYYLGKMLGAQAQFTVYWKTNVNTKGYALYWRLLIDQPQY